MTDCSDYTHFVVLVSTRFSPVQLESGWTCNEDARERQEELAEDGIKCGVFTRGTVTRNTKTDPRIEANWYIKRGLSYYAVGGQA